ncbi:UDP-N-acetylmuramate dehydrogenase [Parvicella tangerina]|uniref:UDP-N-acetylenolpyruvoylglucosamine reductase n=1 Tax=Parvicella tangerina TaxID=2829795 RepID=A0A916JLP8_9FLAO|nr:UDP-N-acetylmuramate dehydrogenase [Parvicella tangerina]CAG5080642.1 UDP-N-acetylenolpyruvoylglucosamine reductase [Parvicella tangerina]
MKILTDQSLQAYNTFGIDVSARLFARATSVNELKELLNSPEAKSNKVLFLGGGSNMLIKGDLDYFVIKLELDGIDLLEENEQQVLVKAGAGVVWHEFVMQTLDKGWYGLENLSLIPGCVGASPIQNIGAYGVEIKDRFESLEALNLETLKVETFGLSDCRFGYRESVFKQELKGKYVILSVTYRLTRAANINTSYGIINQQLEEMGVTNPTPKDVSNAVIAIRQSKLPDPKEIGNSGSFFKNPIVTNEMAEAIKIIHPNMPSYPVDDNHVKLAAGWLIDQAGWKGKQIGNYGVHKKQALVLVNYGGASGQEIYQLSEDIIADIVEKFGVKLEREVNIIE